MRQELQAQQICFVTFANKLSKEKAREILIELRRRFQVKTIVFSPRPPSGRKKILEINGILVIITFPYTKNPEQEQENPTQVPQSFEGGFTLAELAKVNKIKTKT